MVYTRVGYTGGTEEHPSYHDLGDHSEALEVGYDPARVSYDRLLAEFFSSHNPTREPWSVQYRSAIFVADDEQRRAAERAVKLAEVRTGQRISTAVEPLGTFTLAEDYHQKHDLRRVGTVWAELAARYPAIEDLVRSTAAARMNAWVAGHGTEADLRIDELGLSATAREALLRARR